VSRLRLAQIIVATAAVLFFVALGLMRRSLRREPPAPVPKAQPVAVTPSGKCLELADRMGPMACPYGPPAGKIDGIDWGKPFQAGGRCVSAGLLTLTSGQVVATDPLVFAEMTAFARAVPNGRARVLLALSDDADTRDRIAFALLQLGAGRPVRWELATRPKGGSGYFVDAGTGCFADASALALVNAREENNAARAAQLATARFDPNRADEWHRAYDEAAKQVPNLLDVMNRQGYEQTNMVNVCLDPATGTNLVAFESGLGDGSYESYFGLDATGAPVALVTDFGVVEMGAGRHPVLEN
jgi:hypothetical protein